MRILNLILVTLIIGFQAFAAGPTEDQLRIKSSENLYPVVAMGGKYEGENKVASIWSHGLIITYLNTPEQREEYRTVIVDGVLYDTKGNVKKFPADVKLCYVMDSAGNFYVFDNETSHPEVRHSSMLAGGPVAGAGELKVDENGKIKKMDADSGHYSPTNKYFENVLTELTKSGTKVKDIKVKFPETQ